LRVKNWFHRLTAPLLAFLRQGTSPPQLALCLAIGVVVGNIPVLGVSTVLCALIALPFRLNLPAIQLVQAAMAPSQVLLILPFVRLGEWLTRTEPQPLSLNAALALMRRGLLPTIHGLWDAIAHAALAWLLLSPFITYGLYLCFLPLLRRAAGRPSA
jgi:uncharacterized protein (DUF2062 family)